jgi:hypothetical protein
MKKKVFNKGAFLLAISSRVSKVDIGISISVLFHSLGILIKLKFILHSKLDS